MKLNIPATIAVLTALGTTACGDTFRRDIYESLYQRQCLDREATPDCNRPHQSYDQYAREREQALQPKSQPQP